MAVATATIQFAPLRNDLANLPGQLSGMLFNANIPAQGAVVELKRAKPNAKKQSVAFLGWTGLTAAKDATIEIDPTFAQNLGLSHGEKVTLRVIANASVARTVHLEPMTSADWEIVETHVAFLETYMINQVRALSIGQVIAVFPSSTAIASLKVTKLEPYIAPGVAALLSPDSEVIVAPPVSKASSEDASMAVSGSPSAQTVNSTVVRASANMGLDSQARSLELSGSLPLAFQDGHHVLVSLASPPSLGASAQPVGSEEPEISPTKNVLAMYKRNGDSVAISYGLRCALELHGDADIGARLLLKQGGQCIQKTNSKAPITIRPYSPNVTSKVITTKRLLNESEVDRLELGLVAQGLVIPPVAQLLPFGGIVESNRKEWGPASHCELGSELAVADSKKMTLLDVQASLRPVVGQEKVIEDTFLAALNGNGTLLYGSRGSGKSVIVEKVLQLLKAKHIRPVVFKTGAYTDKAVSTVREALKKVANIAAWSAPSLLVFDDIDKLIPAEQEHSGDAQRQQQLAEVFSAVFAPLLAKGKISLLATAQDKTAVHSQLINNHLLDQVLHLRAPDKVLREKILEVALDTSQLVRGRLLDILEVVAETEGYQPGDLWILVDRLAAILATAGTDEVSTKSFMSATKDFTPVSLRGVKLEKPKTKWDEVGGMANVKQVILETLDWPTKYAPVFANCPLRLRSGLLLYGYPGCGKTMLASAIASQTGLNFISVKGPEILNKYIGASEQSVRDLFDRAQTAKPCVLFFDEFDSIAPKRGHDSTGVTDRVVNQLLTQMDGAEGLDGVYVLAATSRPDMIDSALLRPGRLDKSLLCDMPNESERLDILQRAASGMHLSEEVSLEMVAKNTGGFTGADLQALMYSSYLSAVHKVLNLKDEAKPKDKSSDAVSIFQVQFQRNDATGEIGSHILPTNLESVERYVMQSAKDSIDVKAPSKGAEAVIVGPDDVAVSMSESKPSISLGEVAKLRAIYAEFVADRNGEMPPGTSSNEIGGRVTLQ